MSPWSIAQQIAETKHHPSSVYVPQPPFPKNMLMDVSNACNHACSFCANPKMLRRRTQLPLELGVSILRQARDLGTEKVGFYCTGDSFMHPKLPDFVRSAKEMGYPYTYISTNGAIATAPRSKAVLDAGLDSIKFSINAGSRKTYEAIHGKDDWDRVVGNLKFISEYRQTLSRKVYLAITYVVVRHNQNEVESFREEFAPLVDDVHFTLGDCQQGNMLEYKNLLVSRENAITNQAPCYLPFTRLHVTSEGYLDLCCVDYENYLAVSDLNRTPLAEAWNHPDFVSMRERHLKNRLEGTLCHNCITGDQAPMAPLSAELAVPVDFPRRAAENLIDLRQRLEGEGRPEGGPS